MSVVTALIYWLIVAIWLVVLTTVVTFYLRNPRTFGTTRLLLAVLAIDTLRNIVENSYFGVYFGSQLGLFSASLSGLLSRPLLLFVPKFFNVITGCLVLSVLLLRWLPAAIREREDADRATDALRQLATIDELTGLYNRRHFLVLAENEWDRAQRYGRPLSLLTLDVDFLKAINDRNGCDVGDQTLMRIAHSCRNSIRSADIAARIGAEEFAILLPETSRDDARILAERLRQAIAKLDLAEVAGDISTAISIGIAEALPGGNVHQLMKQADFALYTAKHSGRDCVHLFDPSEACILESAA